MSSRDKLRSLFLSMLMITSVFAGTVVLSGNAVANEASNLSIDNSPEVRADDPGSFLIFSFDAEDGSGNSDTFTVNIQDLENANVDNIAAANLAAGVTGSGSGAQTVTSVGTNDPDTDGTPEEITVTLDGGGTSGTQSNVAVGLGTTATGPTTDPSGAGVAASGSALQTEDVAPGFGYTLEVSGPVGDSSLASDSIDVDTIDVTSISPADGSADLGGTEAVTVSAQYASGGEAVQELVSPSLTVVQPDLSNRTETNTGSLTSLSGTVGITVDALNHGDNDLAVQPGQFTDTSGAATNDDAQRNNNALNVDGYRLALDTPGDEVGGVDTVLFNSQQPVNGDIFLTADGANQQVLADDRVIDYTITEPAVTGGAVLASDDTGNGQFTVRESYDETTTSGGEERLDGLTYDVSVTDGSETDVSAISEEVFQTRLDIDFEIDGQTASQTTPTFDSTVQISGTIEDGSGNAINGYRVAVKPYDDTGTLITGEPGTTTTGNNGQFSFTARLPDAVEEPNIDNVVGASGSNAIGFHLGTHLGDSPDVKSTDTAAGPPPHPFVRYQAQPTQPQQANIDISQVNQNSVNFQDTYKIQATDADGDALSSATVVVTGEFSGTTGSEITIANSNGSFTGTPALEDVDGTSPTPDTLAFAVTTNSDGFADIQFTPLAQQITANLTFERTSDIDTTVLRTQTIEGDPSPANDGSFSVPTEPDVAGVETFAVGPAAPVNINNFDVEDEVNSPSGFPNSIFSDAGPEQVEVLPLQGIAGGDTRIEAGDRLGKDTFSDLAGMTEYRVSFDLQDENANNIRPSALDTLEVTGAGVNATFVDANDDDALDSPGDEPGVVSASETSGAYTIIVRPTEVEAANEELEITVDTEDDAPVSEAVATDGLDITQFTTDGSPATVVNGSSTVDVSAFVNTPSEIPVNNGRVRVSELRFISGSVQPDSLGDVDGRQSTTNINNGSYTFNNLDIGPRGIDTDADGIGEQTSRLTFTAYQYNDTDSDGSVNLENNEVTAAAVDTVGIRLTRNLQTDYNESIDFTGLNDDGEYTLTRGVEYDRIEFNLTDQDDNPIDLTQGIDGVTVSDLDDLVGDNIVDLQTTDNSGNTVDLDVQFADAPANDPANGTYVIEDIEQDSSANVDSPGGLSTGDSFVIGSDGTDTPQQTFALDIETPDRSQATNLTQSAFIAADAKVNTTVAGVAGDAVPNSVSDAGNDGNTIDDLNNNQNGFSQLNTNTSEIEQPTANIDRVYRINATVTDALGTSLNSSDFNDIEVDFDGSVDPTTGSNPTGDNAKFEMVSDGGTDVVVSFDDGIRQLGDANSGGVSSSSNNDEVDVNNQNGTFQFDIEVESAGDDGTYTPAFEVQAQDDVTAAPTGKSDATQSPEIQNPVVNVFSQNGGELPVQASTGNQILANGITNELRIEAFPVDEDGFILPDGITFSIQGSFAETQVATSTQNVADVATAQLATEGFAEGQIGFVQATPTGTGNNFANLAQGTGFAPPTVRDINGTPVLFDVLSTNRNIELNLSPANPTAVDDVSITTTDASTGDPVDQVSITVESPVGNTTTILTNATGVATLSSSFFDQSGTYAIDTRRAGYDDASTTFSVGDVPSPSASVTFNDETVLNGTEIVTVDNANFTLANGNAGDYVVVTHVVNNDGSISSPVGYSSNLTGEATDISVDLNASEAQGDALDTLTQNTTLRAMLHETSNNSAFGPSLGLATDDADITVVDAVSNENFTVSNLQAPATAVVGDTIDVNATVTNVGAAGTQTVEFRINGSTAASDSVQLSSGQNTTVAFSVPTGSLAPGNFTHGVFTANDSATAQIQLLQPATFQPSNLTAPANVTVGDQVNATVDVANVGETDGNASISFALNGTNVTRSGGTGAVDIVFALDASGSMDGDNAIVRQGLQNFTATLEQQGLDVRYAVVSFGDRNPDVDIIQRYSDNVTQTRNSIDAVINDGGATEFNYEALNGSINQLSERSNANEVFIDITDEDTENNPRISQSELSQRLENEDIQYIAVAEPGTGPLEKQTLADITAGASFFDLTQGDLGSKLSGAIATQIINQTGGGLQVAVPSGATVTAPVNISTSQLTPGNYTLEVTVGNTTLTQQLTLESGNPFQGSVPGTGGQAPPTDPDGDGIFEDVDGDGTADFDDAVALSFVSSGQLTADQVDALDVDGDGDVDFDDAVDLSFAV